MKQQGTAFQVRLEKMGDNVIDFSEKKLLRLSRTLPSKEAREQCATLLGHYLAGGVAVKWCGTEGPKFVRMPGKP